VQPLTKCGLLAVAVDRVGLPPVAVAVAVAVQRISPELFSPVNGVQASHVQWVLLVLTKQVSLQATQLLAATQL
jgi:hypothetical protein